MKLRSPSQIQPVYDLSLLTLGRVGLWLGSEPDLGAPPLLAPGKALALVTYLACAPGRAAPREHLATLLWSTDDHAHARHALRQLILRLRQHLGAAAIETTRDTALLTASCRVDRDEFLQAIESGDAATALDTYRGGFLPELSFPGGREFDDWVSLERASLSRLFQIAGLNQVQRLLRDGRARQAIVLGRRLRDDAPHEEAAWRPLLEAHVLSGDPVAAALDLAALEAMLSETEHEPLPLTKSLMARLRQHTVTSEPTVATMVAELVGREREFAAVVTTWETVRRSRHPHHVHVWGEPGIGKTRLLHEATRRLRESGARVVRMGAVEGDAAIPWSALARLAGALADCPGARGIAPDSARQLVGLNPALSSVFGSCDGADDASAASGRMRGLAVADLLAAVIHERPVVVVLDDLHWYDTASRDALALLLSAGESQPALVLTAGRLPQPALAARERTQVLHLTPLTVVDLETLVGSIAVPPSAAWGHELAVALQHGSNGNPLMAIESLQCAIAEGLLAVQGGMWTAPDNRLAIASLRRGDAVRDRLAALRDVDAWIMLLLAVAGRPISMDTLTATATDESAVRDAANRLARDGLAVVSEGTCRVAHDLMATHVLTQSSPERHVAAHAALGRVLSTTARTANDVQVAVGHLVAAGRTRDAATLMVREITERRSRGDRRALRLLLHEFGGEPAVLWERQVRARLTWSARWPHWRGVGVGVVGAACLLVAALHGARVPAAPTLSLALGLGAGDSLRLVRLDVDTTAAADGQPLRVEEAHPIATLRPRQAFAGFPRLGQANAGIVLHRFSDDTGAFDVYRVSLSGQLQRLTHARGDDIDPDWSPDGRAVVFQTARWAPDASTVTHIALLEPSSGRISALTTGEVQDGQPRWSPDGTRVAFIRRAVTGSHGAVQLCWTVLRDGPATCHPTRIEGSATLHAWADERHVLVGDSRLRQSVLRHDVEGGTETPLTTGLQTVIAMDPSRWEVGWRPGVTWEVRRGLDGRGRPLIATRDSVDLVAWWPSTGVTRTPITRIDARTSGQLPTNVPLALGAIVRRANGDTAVLAPERVRWTAVSSSVRVESNGTRVRGLTSGIAYVRAEVGGWMSDSLPLRFAPSHVTNVLAETWTDRSLRRWQAFGAPTPRVMVSPGTDSAPGPTSLLVDGDRTFVSGLLSRDAWPLHEGLGAEFMVLVPVQRDAWQRLQLELVTRPRVVLGGVGGTVSCGWHYPAREEPLAYRRAAVMLGGNTDTMVAAPAGRNAFSWHRIRLQWFPDGTCGVAVDGRVVAHGAAHPPPGDPAHVAIGGQSVATQVRVGAVRVWRGIAPGVPW